MKKYLFFIMSVIISTSLEAKNMSGAGPLFTVTGNGAYLNINTTIPNYLYANAGIKINTVGVSPVSCNPAGNGYCFFTVSDTQTAYFLTQGAPGPVNVTLCLDARAQTNNCEQHAIMLTAVTTPTLTNVGIDVQPPNSYGIFAGSAFIPALGPIEGSLVSLYGYQIPQDQNFCDNNNMQRIEGIQVHLSSDVEARSNEIAAQPQCVALCNSSFTGSYQGASSLCTAALALPNGPV